jgi:polysaccharide export outer membrane protein
VIGPGDTLQIVVWRNEELSTTVPVRPDGKITTPLVDDINASGKTPSQLAMAMEEVLAEYLRTPEVSVIVTGQGAANQIQVVGEVTNPQAISFRDDLRVLDVIVAVGGLTDFAAGNRTNLVRQTATGQVECRIKVKDLMSGDMSQNIPLYSGDVLVVPETRF